MHVETMALSAGTMALHVGTMALHAGTMALSVGTMALSAGTMALSVGTMALQEVALDSVAIAITTLEDALLLYHPVNFRYRQHSESIKLTSIAGCAVVLLPANLDFGQCCRRLMRF
ncbi:MAG: hypothetical protein V7K90_28605 [Nostoc sp.]|uniref:hypothetical protein n=1 Tax=Nostoc sp. TaxID=1180 RepID=UPI002FF93653